MPGKGVSRVTPSRTVKKRWAIDRQQLVILLAAAVMLTSFLLLVAWPRMGELQNLGWILTHERQVVNEKVRVSQDGLYVSVRLAALRRMGDRLEERLPDDPHLAEYLQSIDNCVQSESGVTYDIQLATPVIDDAVVTVPIRIRLIGPYEGVYRSLAAMERQDRITKIQNVRMYRAEEGKDVVAEAEIHIYHMPSPEVSSVPSAAPKTEVTSL
jgi:Tfp pilus assembly protein PilO